MRLMALPQEYWTECTLREIASVVGTPLVLDNATLKRLFGHYARILVDIDFSKKIFNEILIEREGGSYPVEVVYERSFTVDLEASTSFGEMSQTQHFVAHDDVQTIPQDGSLVVRSIPDDTATFF